MNAYVERVIDYVRKKHGDEPEFVQTVEEVFTSIAPMIDKHPEYEKADLLTRMVEPEREQTQKEVAESLGISQSYISRLEKKIMLKLRKEMVKQTSCV